MGGFRHIIDDYLERLHWPRSHIRRYTFLVCVVIPCVLAVLVVSAFNDAVTLPALLFTVVLSLFTDVYFAVTAVKRISPPHRELLCPEALTEILQEDQVWRVTIIEIAVRVFVAMVVSFSLVFNLFTGRVEYIVSGYLFSLLIVVPGYVLEPVWRMRTITLLAMTVGAWLNNARRTIIAGFTSVLALFLSEALVIIGVSWLFNSVISNLDYPLAPPVEVAARFEILTTMFFCLMVIAVKYFFEVTQTELLKQLGRILSP